MAEQKPYTPSDVASGNLLITIDSTVYDVSGFVNEHPGGAKILKRVAGKDASKQFWKYHNESVLKKYSSRLKVGTLVEKDVKAKL